MRWLERLRMWSVRVSPSAVYRAQAELRALGIDASVAELTRHHLASDGAMDGLVRVANVTRQYNLPADFGFVSAIVFGNLQDKFCEDMTDRSKREQHVAWWNEKHPQQQ